MVHENDSHSRSSYVYPAECRERHITYGAKLTVSVQWKVDGEVLGTVSKAIGKVPIMVKVCNLSSDHAVLFSYYNQLFNYTILFMQFFYDNNINYSFILLFSVKTLQLV